mmetsp:Transcript_14907/g.36607  ORF Transcript_14907/g.36607 Transcript_14907/m.36607 type:complete len:623 (+) Transcript_14907:577-2445(+)
MGRDAEYQGLDALLRHAHTQPRRKEPARLRPRHNLADGTLVQHHSGGVVQRREVRGELLERRHELLFELLLRRCVASVPASAVSRSIPALPWAVPLGVVAAATPCFEALHRRTGALHGFDQVLAAELDVYHPLRLQHSPFAHVGGVELHLLRVDAGVDDHPGPPAQLTPVRDVHEDGLRVLTQRVHDVRAVLKDLSVHVAQAAGEPAPVGEDDERQALAVHVPDGLRGLEGRVREPHLARLHLLGDLRPLERGVRRDRLLGRARLHRHRADGQPSQARAASDHAAPPVRHHLHERPAVEEVVQQVARVVRRGRRGEADGTVDGVGPGAEGQGRAAAGGDVRQPAQDGRHATHVVGHDEVRHPIGSHHARAADLRVGRVHLAPQDLVERRRAREDQRRVDVLDHALAEATAVGADAHRAAGDVRHGDCGRVRARGGSGDLPAALQALHALPPAHVGEGEAHLACLLVHHAVGYHPPVGAQHLEVVLAEVQVLEPPRRLLRVLPRDAERRLDGLVQADARAAVSADVHAGQALVHRQVERGAVHGVLFGRQRAAHVRDVVGHQDYLAPPRVLLGGQGGAPTHHAHVVLPRAALNLHQRAGLTVAGGEGASGGRTAHLVAAPAAL